MKRVLALTALSLACAVPVAGQQRPDFTGDWTLDRASSLLQGELAAVDGGSLRIDHRDPSFRFTRTFVVKMQPIDVRPV